MKVQSVRFGPEQWRLVQEAATGTGVSAAQFIRDSATARAVAHLLIHSRDGRSATGAELKLALAISDALRQHPELQVALDEALLRIEPPGESEGSP